jgi:tRNA-specific 2-thiouridylase
LVRAADPAKDQTYFLHALTQDQLAWARFPLAQLPKDRVREIAADAGFDNFNRKDSTGICFIGERDFRGFLAHYIDPEPGPIITDSGDYLGEHMGLAFYTIGQRRGLDLGGRGGPWYVAAKDAAQNRLVVVEGHDHPALYSDVLQASNLHWIAGDAPELPRYCLARNRYRQPDQSCLIEPNADGVRVRFDTPQRALTPGQYVVFYDGDECLGGGVIDSTAPCDDEEIDRVSA